jgi:hypothetical protein
MGLGVNVNIGYPRLRSRPADSVRSALPEAVGFQASSACQEHWGLESACSDRGSVSAELGEVHSGPAVVRSGPGSVRLAEMASLAVPASSEAWGHFAQTRLVRVRGGP